MNDKEHELLSAMGNCYQTCHENFEETLRMISGWRGFTTDEVKEILSDIKIKYGQTEEYKTLRKRFPKEFPV